MVEALNIALARRQIDGAGIWRGIEKISRGEGPAGVFASLGPSPVFHCLRKTGKASRGYRGGGSGGAGGSRRGRSL